jgi:hypothetical protein
MAAQAHNSDSDNLKRFNKRLKWQMEHLNQELSYVYVDLNAAKIFIFANESFANNKDLNSQLGFLMVLAHENHLKSSFALTGNIMYWSSMECKRIIRNTLASKIYGMVNKVNIGIAFATTLEMIITRFNQPEIPLIICINSYFLYECLIKLGITQKRRLIIDILALRQLYERKKIAEIRWIHNRDNPANAFIKATANSSLEQLVSTNKLVVRMKEHIERPFAGNKNAT